LSTSLLVTAQHSEPYRKIGRMHVLYNFSLVGMVILDRLMWLKLLQRQPVQWHAGFCLRGRLLSIYRGIHRVGNSSVSPRNFFRLVVENLTCRRRRKNFDESTYQWNNFGVSHKRFKPSMPGSPGLYLVSVVLLLLSGLWSWDWLVTKT